MGKTKDEVFGCDEGGHAEVGAREDEVFGCGEGRRTCGR